MNILVLDTTTERLLVGLATTDSGGTRLITRNRLARSQSPGALVTHAQDLIPILRELMGSTAVQAIGIALGPGSFTGLRIGLATAKGLAAGWGVPLVGLDTLAAMAMACQELVPASLLPIVSVIDARKQKFYLAIYQQGKAILEASDFSPQQFLDYIQQHFPAEQPLILSGYQANLLASALAPHPSSWQLMPIQDWTPQLVAQAQVAIAAGQFLPLEAGPRYIRLSEAEEARIPPGP